MRSRVDFLRRVWYALTVEGWRRTRQRFRGGNIGPGLATGGPMFLLFRRGVAADVLHALQHPLRRNSLSRQPIGQAVNLFRGHFVHVHLPFLVAVVRRFAGVGSLCPVRPAKVSGVDFLGRWW